MDAILRLEWLAKITTMQFTRLAYKWVEILSEDLLFSVFVTFPFLTIDTIKSAYCKVHIFWEGHKILRNLHRRFDRYYIGQIYGVDFAKICGLLRIYELEQIFLRKIRIFGIQDWSSYLMNSSRKKVVLKSQNSLIAPSKLFRHFKASRDLKNRYDS